MTSRSRHPSMAWSPDLDVCRRRLADVLAAEGAPRPEAAAAALVSRGAAGMTPEQWAAKHGVPVEAVAAVEAGHLVVVPAEGWTP